MTFHLSRSVLDSTPTTAKERERKDLEYWCSAGANTQEIILGPYGVVHEICIDKDMFSVFLLDRIKGTVLQVYSADPLNLLVEKPILSCEGQIYEVGINNNAVMARTEEKFGNDPRLRIWDTQTLQEIYNLEQPGYSCPIRAQAAGKYVCFLTERVVKVMLTFSFIYLQSSQVTPLRLPHLKRLQGYILRAFLDQNCMLVVTYSSNYLYYFDSEILKELDYSLPVSIWDWPGSIFRFSFPWIFTCSTEQSPEANPKTVIAHVLTGKTEWCSETFTGLGHWSISQPIALFSDHASLTFVHLEEQTQAIETLYKMSTMCSKPRHYLKQRRISAQYRITFIPREMGTSISFTYKKHV